MPTMFSRRPRRSSSPTAPSQSALIAATSVYNPLAAAAAGAALRDVVVSPPPPEQRTGSIPTKRMLQRRDSYSSTASDPPAAGMGMGRRTSSSSLTQRRFRNSRPDSMRGSPPWSDGTRTTPPPSVRSAGSMRESMWSLASSSIRSAGSMRESLRPQKQESRSVLSRGSLRGDREVPSERRSFSSSSESSDGRISAPVKRRQDAYAESLGSCAGDLENLAEDQRRQRRGRRRSASIIEEEDEDEKRRRDEEDTRRGRAEAEMSLRRAEEEERVKLRREEEIRLRRAEEEAETRRAERRKTLTLLESPRVAQDETLAAPRTPTYAHFGGKTLEAHRHSPPPRSVSPAKSALKHPISEKVPGDTPSSTASERMMTRVRVSFSDEDSVVSFSQPRPPVVSVDELGPRPGLPVFASVKERDTATKSETWRKRETALVEPAPPVTSVDPISSGSEAGDDEKHAVPELVLIEPTPMDEEKEDVAMSTVFEESPEGSSRTYQPPAPKQADAVSPSSTPLLGSFEEPPFVPPADDPASDSDSSSLYEDALEDVTPPAEPTMNPLSVATADSTSPFSPPQSPASSPPRSPRQTNAGNRTPIPRPPSPPLPASFSRPTPTPSRRRSLTPPPRRRPSRRQTPPLPRHDDSDAASVSSFRRANPRSTGGFRRSMRTAPPVVPGRRFSEDSSDDEAGGVRRRFGLGGGGREGTAWRSRYEDSSSDGGDAVTARSSGRPATAAGRPRKLRKQSFKNPPAQGDGTREKKGLFGLLGKKGKEPKTKLEKMSDNAMLDAACSTGQGTEKKDKKRWWKFGH